MRIKTVHSLTAAHLAFYSFIALYLGAFHPGSGMFIAFLYLTGVFVELLPRFFRRGWLPEILLAAVTIGFLANARHETAGMALAYWVLIPGRLGRLKWVLVLALVELVLMARLPASGFALVILLPLGLAALGVDRWLLDSLPASDQANPKRTFFRWAITPVIVVTAVSLMAGSWVVAETTAFHLRHHTEEENNAAPDELLSFFDGSLAIGNHRAIIRDAQPVATLSWESGAPPGDMVYLRALALPNLQLSESTIAWKPGDASRLRPVSAPARPPNRWAKLYRMPSRTDMVLRVDGGRATELPNVFTDEDGNLYCPQLRGIAREYRVDFDDGQAEADPATFPRCREVDPLLTDFPWTRLEDPRWARVRPEQAARLIGERLETHCRYDIENLPLPAPGTAGVLRGFLFGHTLAERTGHCQYFATAAVLLLRRAGHTARCVGGYASDEMDGRSLVFRGLHAHAWIEVVNSQGRWQRFDPTPSLRNERILEGIDLKTAPLPKKETPGSQEMPPDGQRPAPSWSPGRLPGWLIPLLLVVGALWAIITRLGGRSRKLENPRMAELRRRNDDLIQVAVSLGIGVTPATTLSALAAALERLTGIPLAGHLRAHLAARFGQGPLPEPWPLAELLAARSHAPEGRFEMQHGGSSRS